MKPINEKELEVCGAPSIREHVGVVVYAMTKLAALSHFLRPRHDLDQLPARLRRDAGLDELAIEQNRLTKAPLIR